ncbi:22508_t:CDS:2, partial [Gigaspora rosea]
FTEAFTALLKITEITANTNTTSIRIRLWLVEDVLTNLRQGRK